MTQVQGEKAINVLFAILMAVILMWLINTVALKSHLDEESRFFDTTEVHMVEEERRADERLNLLYSQCEREAHREGAAEPNIVCGTIGKEQR
jgi:hypothetical protein